MNINVTKKKEGVMTPFFLFIRRGLGAKPSKSKAMSHIARRVTVHTNPLWDSSVHTNPLLAIFKRPKMT
jgi:hypothetical protein